MSKASPVKKEQPPKEPVTYHNELIHEVEETLKQQELEKFWKDYGSYVIAAIISVVLLTAVMSGWRSYSHRVNASQTAILMTAMSADENALADKLAAALPSLKSGHRALAYLSEAGALTHAGKKDEALAVYNKAAADTTLPAPWHDLSVLLAVRAQWAQEDGKKEGNAKALLSGLSPLTQNTGSPWHYHALLLAAQISAHGLNDFAAAHENLAAIMQAQDIPPSLAERARALDHIFSIRAAEMNKKDSKG